MVVACRVQMQRAALGRGIASANRLALQSSVKTSAVRFSTAPEPSAAVSELHVQHFASLLGGPNVITDPQAMEARNEPVAPLQC
eukprot:6205242-Pleurochrysis_carterae.AAC.2